MKNVKEILLLENWKRETETFIAEDFSPSEDLLTRVMTRTPVEDSIFKILFVFISAISKKDGAIKINWLTILLDRKLHTAIIELIRNLKKYAKRQKITKIKKIEKR